MFPSPQPAIASLFPITLPQKTESVAVIVLKGLKPCKGSKTLTVLSAEPVTTYFPYDVSNMFIAPPCTLSRRTAAWVRISKTVKTPSFMPAVMNKFWLAPSLKKAIFDTGPAWVPGKV